jgi:hypothetical protein
VISELNTLIPLLNMASKMGKQTTLSIADKLDIITKGDTQLHVTKIKLAEELGIPVPTFNNITANKNNILQQGGSSKPSRTNNF